ncbi:MAG: 50S ribosomal protein L30 [Clostridiales bacterium]|jgi:large subunit ribosomal protein L30|nr:50S ribosomal protein L30 [Clostridiales bacterium]
MAGELKVTLLRSTIGSKPKQRKTIEALGLGKINSVKLHKDNGAIRGMLRKVSHMVKVEEI